MGIGGGGGEGGEEWVHVVIVHFYEQSGTIMFTSEDL